MLPNFICPGSPKAATTTLFAILNQHPDVYMPDIKETNFFGLQALYERGVDWYEQEFYSDTKGRKIVGDISTGYMQYASLTAKRLHDALGNDMKFIFMLRNPVTRAYSHYCMVRYSDGKPEPEFEELADSVLDLKDTLTKDDYIHLSKGYSYVGTENMDKWRYMTYFSNGFYYAIISEFLKYFPIENMRFILFEDYIADSDATMNEIYDFLGLEKDKSNGEVGKTNQSGYVKHKFVNNLIHAIARNNVLRPFLYKVFGHSTIIKYFYKIKRANKVVAKPPKMSIEANEKLSNYYRDDIDKLEKLINIDLSCWKIEENN